MTSSIPPTDRAAGTAPQSRRAALPATSRSGGQCVPGPDASPRGSGSGTPSSGESAPDTSALSPGQMAVAAAMSEDKGPDSLDAHVRRLMKGLGLWGYHPWRSDKSEKGWPDWTILGTRVLYRELKSETGALKPDQREVRDRLLKAGADWGLWRPSDLLSQRIATELRAISGTCAWSNAPRELSPRGTS